MLYVIFLIFCLISFISIKISWFLAWWGLMCLLMTSKSSHHASQWVYHTHMWSRAHRQNMCLLRSPIMLTEAFGPLELLYHTLIFCDGVLLFKVVWGLNWCHQVRVYNGQTSSPCLNQHNNNTINGLFKFKLAFKYGIKSYNRHIQHTKFLLKFWIFNLVV